MQFNEENLEKQSQAGLSIVCMLWTDDNVDNELHFLTSRPGRVQDKIRGFERVRRRVPSPAFPSAHD